MPVDGPKGRLDSRGERVRSLRALDRVRQRYAEHERNATCNVCASKSCTIWRAREWKPALEAAGIGHGTICTLRHFATNAIGAGIGLFELARYMGTSVDMLDRVYGHLVAGAEQAARAKLDAAAGRSGV
jgi:integrase